MQIFFAQIVILAMQIIQVTKSLCDIQVYMKQIIILFLKPNQCMLPTTNQMAEQDMAVSSLLEIDYKQQEDLNIWQDKKTNKVNQRLRRYSLHKPNTNKPPNPPKITNEETSRHTSSQNNYHQALKQSQHKESTTMNPQEQSSNCNSFSKSIALNPQEHAQSKINWIRDTQKKQPRLNKKLCIARQSGYRRSHQQISRYEDDHKTRSQEHKTCLIYNLLTNKDIIQYKCQANSQKKATIQKKASSLQQINTKINNIDTPINLNTVIQTYMRQTLKRIYQKNRSDDHNSQQKQSQQQRSSIVRELLMNLQNAKDNHSTKPLDPNLKQNKQLTSVMDSNHIDEAARTTKKTQRKFFHQYNPKNILNLNLQAEKFYQTRSTNQLAQKKPLLKMQ